VPQHLRVGICVLFGFRLECGDGLVRQIARLLTQR
jgi:hypothetical protein